MTLWREAGHQLRRVASRTVSVDRRHISGLSGARKQLLQSTKISQTVRRDSYVRGTGQSRRQFSVTSVAAHGHITPPKPGEEINVSFIDKDGEKYDFQVSEGDNLLDIAQANDLEMEGACGGSCACSTCHVIVEDADLYDRMPEPDDDENDMLDLAFGLTETSRLGCQVKMTKDLDGLVVRLPAMTRNLQASDFK
ncbi:2Fe-2S iron-sulfur cluster binding domain protein [Talaromyces pinophilus]|uniref:2Fe-2S iron-sulfur cluster binding domain protein n=1 Tax=Talaromyces pinophilus TaxID=128442 RepID=A0A510NVQ8_TALPI|nr:Adrenodoxin [Talaromyces pinophilus]GAM36173.1 2Fe-2S iron-sulfur cluster binding domain protein [Talaromyces pinophilus]